MSVIVLNGWAAITEPTDVLPSIVNLGFNVQVDSNGDDIIIKTSKRIDSKKADEIVDGIMMTLIQRGKSVSELPTANFSAI